MNYLRRLLMAIGILPKTPREPYYKTVLHALPTILIVTAIMFVFDMLGWLRGFETAAIDGMLMVKTAPASSQIVVVTIDNEDYRTLFGGKSPIDPDALKGLISAIAKGKPALIGVDIDTTAPEFAAPKWPPAVWARDAEVSTEDDTETASLDLHEPVEYLVRLPILGGAMEEKLDDRQITTAPKSGLVVFPQDFDGVVRRYRREYLSDKADPPSELEGEVATLPWAVVKEYAAYLRAHEKGDSTECKRIDALERQGKAHELVLNFAGDRYHFDRIAARHIMAGSQAAFWPDNAPVRDMIVLVGGTYRSARDEYVTPVGRMYGVELIAHAIESDLRGGGIREVNRIVAAVLEFSMSLLLLYICWRFPSRYMPTISIAAIICLSLLGSLLAFNAFAYWFNFTAVLVSTWIELLWEQGKERRELRREVETLRLKLAGGPAGPAS